MSKNKDNSIDLTEIPLKNGKVDWKNSTGCKCNFIYKDINDVIEIIGLSKNTNKIKVKYKDKVNEILIDSFRNCALAYVIGLKNNDYVYNIGDVITTKHSTYKITNQKRKRNHRYYDCICERGHIFDKAEYSMDSCIYCSGRYTVKGETDIATTNIEMFNMLAYKEFGYSHKQNSTIKTDWICPDCNDLILNKSPNQVYVHGLGCSSCSDGISYGEKFIYNLMRYLNINIKMQYTKTDADWCKTFRYDAYLSDFDYIIECHGLQHYEENSNFKMSLIETQENDKNKELLANEYVTDYIIIDCRQSTLSHVKKSIINSKLYTLLNLNKYNIDWKLIHKQSIKSKVKISCDLWNEGKSTKEISTALDINENVIRRYLKNGSMLNMCKYDAYENKLLSYEKLKEYNKQNRSKPMVCNETNMAFCSISLCEKLSEELLGKKLDSRNIGSVLNGKRNHTGNFTFQYITRSEFNSIKQNPLTNHLAYGDYFISTEQPTKSNIKL